MATVPVPVIWEAYRRRIEDLRDYGEDDGIHVNKDSERDFWSFVHSAPLSEKAALFLMDNGNLRAVWKGGDSSHIGLQFLGCQKAEYVIFKRQKGSEGLSRVAGVDTLIGVRQRIRDFNLTSLVSL
ncbi:MAG: hypothetical protein F4Z35_01870 [Dehalococcoidia bacterium]|nr:hypothetical protein [Dehalococcoidia bacterium]